MVGQPTEVVDQIVLCKGFEVGRQHDDAIDVELFDELDAVERAGKLVSPAPTMTSPCPWAMPTPY